MTVHNTSSCFRRTVSAGAARPAARTARGLTLAEVLISVVIFGIGLTMAASIFPAALKLNKSSADDVIGTLIGQNALTIAQARLFHDEDNPLVSTEMERIDDKVLSGGETIISERDRRYPLPKDRNDDEDDETLLGWLLLGRKITSNADDNDYLLVAVSYRKSDENNTIEAVDESVKIVDYENVSKADFGGSFPNNNEVQQNGVIIFENGRHAYMVGLDAATGEAVLDRRLPDKDSVDVWLVYEDGPAVRNSPVMAVVVGRTSLRPLPNE